VVVGLIAGLSAAGATAAMAKDYGTVGTTWSIAEPDLLTIIRARLLAAQSSGALDAMNQKFVATAQASANRPHPVGGISPAQTDREWSYDPTVTIAEDIRDAKGNLIAAKGQKFNPLTRIGMAHAFAFVDGDNAEQMAWAVKQGDPDKLWIVLVDGSPIERMKEFKRRFYFDQQGVLTSKFGITHTPALLSQHGNVVDIHEVALSHLGGGQ
jgi:conjugal transfer pilus assembly protein TraW